MVSGKVSVSWFLAVMEIYQWWQGLKLEAYLPRGWVGVGTVKFIPPCEEDQGIDIV